MSLPQMKRFTFTMPQGRPRRTKEPLRIPTVASGAKVRSRPRLNQSSPLPGQQSQVCRGYAQENAYGQATHAEKATKCLKTLGVLLSTSDTHRSIAGVTPGPHCLNTGRARKEQGKRKNEEHRKQKVSSASEGPKHQRVT